jgi:hypothetical protein
MRRRGLLATAGTGVVWSIAGCTDGGQSADDTTPQQEPANETQTDSEQSGSENGEYSDLATVEYTVDRSGERRGFRGVVSLDISGTTATKTCYSERQAEPTESDARRQFTEMERLQTLVAAADPETWDPEHATLNCEAAYVDGSCTTIAVATGDGSYETGFGSLEQDHVPAELPTLVRFLRAELDRFEDCERLQGAGDDGS